MTLAQFVAKNALRNKRRSMLTAFSIAFSLLLLTLMLTIWQNFYGGDATASAAQRLMTRHRVSLTFFIPAWYRERIRGVQGVVGVAPMNWFGGKYKDDRPENFFPQFSTDPNEIFELHPEWNIDPVQLSNWQRDRSGAVVSRNLADKYGWKIGDRVNLSGLIYPVNPELTVRGIYDAPEGWMALLFHDEYITEAVAWFKGHTDLFNIMVDSPDNVARVARTIDDMFANAPQPTKTETEKAFQLGFVAMLGNVKAFILGISGAVVFAILLVSANTMAMSIRERIREVAVLKTIGFSRRAILGFFIAEGVVVALIGGGLGILAADGLVYVVSNSPAGAMLGGGLKLTPEVLGIALFVAAFVGFTSAIIPAMKASQLEIAQGLRHVG